MWLLLVLCLIVIIFPVLCPLHVLRFISNLREEICSRSEEPHWPHCEMSLIAGSTARCGCPHPQDFHEKLTRLLRLCVDYSSWGRKTLTIFLSCIPVHQKDLRCKHYCTTDCPWSFPGYAVLNGIGCLQDTQVQLVGLTVFCLERPNGSTLMVLNVTYSDRCVLRLQTPG